MEEETNFSEDLRRYIGLAWHWAWLFVIIALIAGGAAYALSTRITPVYQAVSTALIDEAPSSVRDYSSLIISQQLAETYSQLMIMEPVMVGVKLRLGLNEIPSAIMVEPVKDSQLITITVEDTDPNRAAAVANTLPIVFAEQNRALQEQRFAASKENLKAQLDSINVKIEEQITAINRFGDSQEINTERDVLQAALLQYQQTYSYLLQSYEEVRLAEAQSISNISIIQQAYASTVPIRPQPLQNAALAAVVGVMLTAGLVFLLEALDDTLKSPEDVTSKLGLPVLGMIARHDSNGKPVTVDYPRAAVSEAFRSLRTNLSYASIGHPIKTLMVTSPSPEDGKSTVVSNLGVIMAQSGSLVAILDADLRKPRVHVNLGLDNASGMTNLFMQSKVILNGELQPTSVPNLVAVTSGQLPLNPAELVGSAKMTEIIRAVNRVADITIMDTPPLLPVTDALAMAPRTDGVLLVMKPGTTKISHAREAVEQLKRVGANILGVVLNDVNIKRTGYRYSYYNRYGEYYGDKPKTHSNGKHTEAEKN